ncbi:ribbon-helix-helix protein, CopG family [Azospirillum sp.]|uniref:ribbon-helix-helix protein, CopG family n=1 Tax=Azospirillum sp. TaxID=34012 RepID=UPI003D757135
MELRAFPASGKASCMEKKDVRIQLVMSPSELEKLDEWRAKRRIWSRSEAIRRLVSEGIDKDAGAAAKDGGGND